MSLNPLFRRDYNSLYKGIQEFLPHQTDDKYLGQVNRLLDAVSCTIPTPKFRPFNLFGIDTTPYPRPYSATLADKTFIHYPNPIKGNKPISIGHSYSVVCALPERIETGNVPWAVPLSGERISASEKFTDLGNNQLQKIFKSSSFGREELSVLVADSLYSQRGFIGEQVKHKNLVTITRVRSNRVFYRQFIPPTTAAQKSGHPRWYGDKFDLKDETTWHEPNKLRKYVLEHREDEEAWKEFASRPRPNAIIVPAQTPLEEQERILRESRQK